MENKQIVDGIDVSGCKHYKNRNCIADYCLTDMPFSEAKCELNPNCYYKQLQREKQNSQEARDIAIKEFNRAEELKTLLKRKEQECEELKKTIMYKCPQCGDEYLSPMGASLYEENNKLKQTLAEIKEIVKPHQRNIDKICGHCRRYDCCHACCIDDINCYQYKKTYYFSL